MVPIDTVNLPGLKLLEPLSPTMLTTSWPFEGAGFC